MTNDPIKVLNEHGLAAVYSSATNDGEYKSPCPHCRSHLGDGGSDRLCVWPAQGNAWCRQCGWRGPLAELLRLLTPMSREKAESLVGRTRVFRDAYYERTRRVDRERWRQRAEELAERCAGLLFREEGEEYLEYLMERGLDEGTIRAAGLGAMPERRYYKPGDFGVHPYTENDGQPPTVCAPAGIVIPHRDASGACCKLLFRCDDESHGKYRVLLGSEAASLVLPPDGRMDAAVVVESALDAHLCRQEVPEGFAFIGLGSAAYRLDERAEALVRKARIALIATDSDDAGAQAFRRMRRFYPNAHRLIVPRELGKDAGEAFLNGMPIADWCEAGLELARARNGRASPASARKQSNEPPNRQRGKKSAAKAQKEHVHVNYELVTGKKRAKALVKQLTAGDDTHIAIDIETAPLPEYADDPGAALDPWRSRPRLVQATTGGKVYVFDLYKVPLESLAPLFADGWVAHNGLFDYKHLLQAELTPEPHPPYCTMLCDNAVSNRLRSLADLAAERLGIHVDKSMQRSDWSAETLDEGQLQYAANDAEVTLRLWEELRRDISRRNRDELCKLMHDAQQSVALMELNGIGLDLDRHSEAMRGWRRKRKKALAELRALAGDEVNPRSAQQMASLLETSATKAQLGTWPRTKGGQLSTTADDLAAFADIPVVAVLLAYRRWNDLLTRFGSALAGQVNPVTGRLHSHFHIARAKTGRMSASGPNVQGLPRDAEFRRLFVPQEGYVFVRADYNQMQLRIAALLSGDARLLAAYEQGKDVHRLTAASVLGKRPSEVTGEERTMAKAIGFGLLFGMGAAGLMRYARASYGVVLSKGQAERLRERFFATYPGVREWQLAQVDEAERTECSVTPMGRVRDFAGERKHEFFTAAMNTPIQGAEGEVMLAALALLPKAFDPLDALVVNCVHDEILVECPEANVPAVAAALRDCMERGMRRVFPKATLKNLVEVGHGPTWGDAK